jgi:hypothetical protein
MFYIKCLAILNTLAFTVNRTVYLILKPFNFPCNTVFYYLQNWGDFVSPDKKSISNINAQTW